MTAPTTKNILLCRYGVWSFCVSLNSTEHDKKMVYTIQINNAIKFRLFYE